MSNFLTRSDIEAALSRLGELAAAQGHQFEILVLGGTAMVLGFDARESTKDVDVAILPSTDVALVRRLTERVAEELDWESDWLNDAAKGFLFGPVELVPVSSTAGIRVFRPSTAQLLAMKLAAWRDDVDIADADLLLRALTPDTIERTWQAVVPHLPPGRELKARYALEDLWQSR